MITSILFWVMAILLAPFFSAVILKVKAFFGGKKGPPLLINYYTLVKLFKKSSVYSTSTTFIFKLGPMVSLGAAVTALLFLPFAGHPPVFSFRGDLLFILCLLGLGRFFTIAAAMDTASPFEGMGAAREAYFPIICEATLFMILILFYILTGELRLAAYFSGDQTFGLWQAAGLAENWLFRSRPGRRADGSVNLLPPPSRHASPPLGGPDEWRHRSSHAETIGEHRPA